MIALLPVQRSRELIGASKGGAKPCPFTAIQSPSRGRWTASGLYAEDSRQSAVCRESYEKGSQRIISGHWFFDLGVVMLEDERRAGQNQSHPQQQVVSFSARDSHRPMTTRAEKGKITPSRYLQSDIRH